MNNLHHNSAVFFAGSIMGLLALILLFFPDIDLLAMNLLFEGLFIWAGIVNILHYGSFTSQQGGRVGYATASGIADIVLGILFVINIFLPLAILPYLIASYLIIYGIFQLFPAYALRGLGGTGAMVFSSVFAIGFAITMFIIPSLMPILVDLFMLAHGVSMLGTIYAHQKFNNTNDNQNINHLSQA